MQSSDKKSSPLSRRGSTIECKDPIRKNIIQTLSADNLSANEIHKIIIRAYAFVMHFANYESGGVMNHIFKIEVVQLDSLMGSFDKKHTAIQYHAYDEEDINSKITLQMVLDESIITVPLAKIYDQYDLKLCFLATLFFMSYKNYKSLTEQLEALKLSNTSAFLPSLPEHMSDEMRAEMEKLIKFKKIYNKEFKTSTWEELDNKINSITPLNFSKLFDDVARKFFNVPYFAGSQAYELLTVACYIQETIVYVATNYLRADFFPPARMQFYQERWRKYISVQCKMQDNPNNRTEGRLVTNIDKQNPRQMKDAAIVSKIVDFEKLNHFLSSEILKTMTIEKIYFTVMFDEMETFFARQQRKIDAATALKTSPDARFIYANDFALEFLRHAVVNEAVSAWGNDNNKRESFKKEFIIEANALTAYAHIKSSGKVVDLASASFTFLKNQKSKTLEDVARCFSKGYFDFAKIQAIHDSLPSLSAKLYFLLNVYTSAGMIIFKLYPPMADQIINDDTNYNDARIAIANIEKKTTEENSAENRLLAASSQQTQEAPRGHQHIPFTGLDKDEKAVSTSFVNITDFEFRDILKQNALSTLVASGGTKLEICKAMVKVCEFILKLCDYESRGLMPDIVGFQINNDAGVLGSFDNNACVIKWHPKNDNDITDKAILIMLVNEKAITVPLAAVYSDYQARLTYLFKLFIHTYTIYRGYREQLSTLDSHYADVLPVVDPNVEFESIVKIEKYSNMTVLSGIEPFTVEWKDRYTPVIESSYSNEAAQADSIRNHLEDHAKNVVAKKYFYIPNYPGSHLNELATAACFIQETIYYISTKYTTADILNSSAPHFFSTWKNYVSIKAFENENRRIEVKVDYKNLQQVREVGIINKLVNLDALNTLLSPEVILAKPYKEVYFKMLLDQVTTCLHSEKIVMSETPAPALDPDLECIFSSDFALAYSQPENIMLAAKAFANDGSAKQRFYKTICIEACALMAYANLNSGIGRMAELTGFDLDASHKIANPKTHEEISICLINGYFNFAKIKSQYFSLKTLKEQLHFLSNIYISAGVLILRINSPQQLIVDRTQYNNLRERITLIENASRAITEHPPKLDPHTLAAVVGMASVIRTAKADVWPETISEAEIKRAICDKYINLTTTLDNHDFIKSLCFIQAAFNVATHNYFLDVEYAHRKQVILRRWKKHLSVYPKFSSEKGLEIDVTSQQQRSELDKLKSLINLDNVNRYITTHMETLSLATTNGTSLLRKLFEEIEDYIVGEIQKISYKHTSVHLDVIYTSDFAKTNLRHMAVEELAAKYSSNEDITDLYNDLSIGINKFMEYCDRISGAHLVTITGHDYKISPMTLSRSEVVSPLAKLRHDANIYFNVDKFEKEFNEKITYKAKLEFLTTVFIEAYGIEKSMLKAHPNQTITTSIARPNGNPLRTISSIPMTKIDVNKVRTQIMRIVKASERNDDDKPSQQPLNTLKQKKVREKKSPKDNQKAQEKTSPRSSTLAETAINPKLHNFQIEFYAAKGLFKNIVDLKITSLLDELKSLDNQLQQTLALDNEDRQYNLRPHKALVAILKREVYSEIDCLVSQIKRAFEEMKPEEEDKIDANIISLKDITAQRTTLEANHEKLLAEIQQEALVLDHIIPKKTLKKAEELYLEAQRKKERLAREQEEEKSRPKKEKVARSRAKPAANPVASLSLTPRKLTAPVKKSECKSSKADPKAALRLLHLNEACKNLIFIQKLLTVYKADLNAEVVHFALLYNIFRCFQSLKMYQQKGGHKRSLNPDIIINLRNMIIHHGATSAHPEIVEAFAAEMNAKLPKDILKLTHRSLSGFELPQNRRQELMVEFNLIEPSIIYNPFLDHSALVLDDTPLYKKLAAFHEEKSDNDDSAPICESILKTYIPIMKNILPPLLKVASTDSEMKAEHFFDTFYFEIQALRMLATICGEFEAHFRLTYKDKNLQELLSFCRINVRNIVAHENVDLIESQNNFRQLSSLLLKVEEKRILAKPVRTYSAAFFSTSSTSSTSSAGSAGSAMDAKYDKKPPAKAKRMQ
jgi:hypothetical protein